MLSHCLVAEPNRAVERVLSNACCRNRADRPSHLFERVLELLPFKLVVELRTGIGWQIGQKGCNIWGEMGMGLTN